MPAKICLPFVTRDRTVGFCTLAADCFRLARSVSFLDPGHGKNRPRLSCARSELSGMKRRMDIDVAERGRIRGPLMLP